MQKTIRTRVVAIVLAALAVIATPALLLAHARLVRSTPAANGRLTVAPTALHLWFSEQPEVSFTGIQLLDSAGAPIALGAPASARGNALEIDASIERALANGRYTVVWHTAAADGHASNGRFSFTVDAPTPPAPAAPAVAAAAAPVIVPLPGPVSPAAPGTPIVKTNSVLAPTSTAPMSTGVRWVELVALLTIVGAVIYRLFVLGQAKLSSSVSADSADRARRLAQAALVLFLVATLTRVVAQSQLISTASDGRFAAVVAVVSETRWGRGWMVGFAGAIISFAGLFVARRVHSGWLVAAIGVAVTATSEGLTGHAGASAQHLPLAIAVDVAHLLGAGGWIGGLAALMLAGFPALRSLGETERRAAGMRLVRSFHRSATESVILVLVSAVIAAWLRLGTLTALWTSRYGELLLLKLALVAGLLAFGLFHWRTAVIPEWDDDTKFRFQRSATFELILGAVVLAVTAVLIGTSLPSQ